MNRSRLRRLWLLVLLPAVCLVQFFVDTGPAIVAAQQPPALPHFGDGRSNDQAQALASLSNLPFEPDRGGDPAVLIRNMNRDHQAGVDLWPSSNGPQIVPYRSNFSEFPSQIQSVLPNFQSPLPTPTPPAGTGSLIGLTTDAATGGRLAGVGVSVAGQTTVSNSAGLYRFDNVAAGWQSVAAEAPGYRTTQKARLVVAGELVWNSLALAAESDPSPTPSPTTSPPPPTATPSPTGPAAPTATVTPEMGSLIGLITDAESGERLAGVLVSAQGQAVQTSGNGLYLLRELPPGSHPVLAQHPDFEPAVQTGLVVAGQIRWNSIALTAAGQATPTPSLPPTPTPTATPLPTVPPTPTPSPTATPTPAGQTGTLIGLVTDIASGERLSGVTVSVAGQAMVTGERGVYRFEAAPVGLQIVRAEKDGYRPGQKSRQVIADEVRWNSIKLERDFDGCPVESGAAFELIPVKAAAGDPHPDHLHGDLNLAQRGYSPTNAGLSLQDYAGGVDPNAPQLAGLFEPDDFPGISAVYRAHHWDWNCGEHGCPGPVITDWPVTLLGLATTPGQAIHLPERAPQIYSGGFKAVVLYAEEKRLTLGYTRDDSVAFGYAVHLENVCVDPNLLALYRAQNDAAGFRTSGLLPALRSNQPLGVAFESEIQAAIRDRGAFMDPRSRKDWWRGY